MNDKGGRLISWVLLPLLVVVLLDVTARRVANSPTYWGHELSYMVYGFFWIMGGAYTLLHGGHTSIDSIVMRLSPHARTYLALGGYALLFFPFVIAFLVQSFEFAAYSWSHLQTTGETLWDPPVYPLKTAIPVGFTLLALQGISEVTKLIKTLKRTPHG
jgi:TRAP-type mannitol/chloroaromatic compound transport system permease small subunit